MGVFVSPQIGWLFDAENTTIC